LSEPLKPLDLSGYVDDHRAEHGASQEKDELYAFLCNFTVQARLAGLFSAWKEGGTYLEQRLRQAFESEPAPAPAETCELIWEQLKTCLLLIGDSDLGPNGKTTLLVAHINQAMGDAADMQRHYDPTKGAP
jgi:hypothetical protein